MASLSNVSTPYDLHPSVAYVQSILSNLEAKTGRSLEAWVALIRKAAPAETKARIEWLKEQGLGSNQASLVAHRASNEPGHAFGETPEGYLAAAPAYVDAQYGGKKAALRPLFERIVSQARGLGTDVKVCPCETIVPFYRNHVFAEVKPFTTRLDLGLALGDPATVKDPSGRLKDTGGFKKKDRITHKLEFNSETDLELAQAWLKQAYERDGPL
jgi:predicted transport protein